MSSAKTLSIISGFISLFATFVITLFTFELAENTFYVSGILGIRRIFYIFVEPNSIFYILGAIFLLFFLFSGALQLIGARERSLAVVGSILPLFFGLIIVFNSSLMGILYVLGDSEPLIQGIFPTDFGRSEPIGAYLLILGGFLGIISGLKKRGGV